MPLFQPLKRHLSSLPAQYMLARIPLFLDMFFRQAFEIRYSHAAFPYSHLSGSFLLPDYGIVRPAL